MIIYKFQCYPVKSSHPRHLPQSPKDCSVHLCLFCCLAYRVIVTIFLNSIYMRWCTILVLFFLSLTFEHCLASWHYQILRDCLVHFLPPVKNQPFLQGVLVPSTGHLYVVSQEAKGGQMTMSSLTDARMSRWPSKYLYDRLYNVQLGPQNMQASDTAKMITRFCPHPSPYYDNGYFIMSLRLSKLPCWLRTCRALVHPLCNHLKTCQKLFLPPLHRWDDGSQKQLSKLFQEINLHSRQSENHDPNSCGRHNITIWPRVKGIFGGVVGSSLGNVVLFWFPHVNLCITEEQQMMTS